MHDFVRAQEETTARLATGFVGRGLIASHAYERIKAFFAESNRSDLESLFTELAADERETVETGIDLLEERDFEEGRREEVVSLAVRTVDIAASELTESIE
ncbi:hypothetical protein [Halovivax ruber]|nr:hypothetical protein [Halovivax ruber]